jgi:hypothetical protein
MKTDPTPPREYVLKHTYLVAFRERVSPEWHLVFSRNILCISNLSGQWRSAALRKLNDCFTCFTSRFTSLTSVARQARH